MEQYTISPEDLQYILQTGKDSSAAYSATKVEADKDREDVYVIHNQISKAAEGFVYYNPKLNAVICSLKGTDSLRDFKTDATFANHTFSGHIGPFSLLFPIIGHSGFIRRFLDISMEVYHNIEAVRRAHPNAKEVVFTGHSLGAALAEIGSVLYAMNYNDIPVRFITHEAPRVFEKATWEQILSNPATANLNKTGLRLWRTNDMIESINPTWRGARHLGQSLKIPEQSIWDYIARYSPYYGHKLSRNIEAYEKYMKNPSLLKEIDTTRAYGKIRKRRKRTSSQRRVRKV